MKKVIVIFMVMLMITLVGCSSKEVKEESRVFKGENENWRAEYKSDLKLSTTDKNNITDWKGETKYKLVVTYKKDTASLSKVKKLIIFCETPISSCRHEEDYSESRPLNEKSFVLSGGSSSLNIEKKSDILKLTITRDDTVEIIDLVLDN
ncbi:MAG: hypothetical protein RR898_06835 [Clostridium sp.]|uniref:hypothetical protein n=1 Tax=Clostridium sp. TaxID=1506 RepID=UPI002FC6B58A